MEGRLEKGERLSPDDVLARIHKAVDDICDDCEDMAVLHSIVAQGQVEFNPDENDFVVVDDKDAELITVLRRIFSRFA